jgi:hypothetical protein
MVSPNTRSLASVPEPEGDGLMQGELSPDRETVAVITCTEAFQWLALGEQRRVARYIWERYGVAR